VTESQVDVIVDSIDALRSILDEQQLLPADWTLWFDATKIVLTGIGKSYDVACLGASLLQTVGYPAQAIHATDLLHGGFGIFAAGNTATLVLLSNSGRTREILEVVDHVRQLRVHGRIIRTVAITRLLGDNVLAARVQHTLRYAAPLDGSSHGTIPSVSTTAQLAWLNVIACVRADFQTVETLALSHPAGSLADVYERMSSE
jgi:arabinose-5-phosphate isomerase